MKNSKTQFFRCLRFTSIGVLAFLQCACTMYDSQPDKNKTTVAGAGSLFNEPYSAWPWADKSASFTALDYCKLLHSYGFSEQSNCIVKVDTISETNANFGRMRNELQDNILAASNQKCGEYKRSLYSTKADSEMSWGSLATLLSGTGAVVTHLPTAQAFSAGGAVASGIRSEVSQAYFANLAVEVITAGIQSRQDDILRNINESRKSRDYSLNAAVSDALAYHSACSAVAGLEVAHQSITRVDNPGAKELRRFWEDIYGIAKKDGQGAAGGSGAPGVNEGTGKKPANQASESIPLQVIPAQQLKEIESLPSKIPVQ